jgi:hypothetical protein
MRVPLVGRTYLCEKTRPSTIDELWTRGQSLDRNMEFEHLLAQELDYWATKAEITALLGDKERLQYLANRMYRSYTLIGQL